MTTPSSRSKLLPVAVALFALGLLAVVIVFLLYALGMHDLPVWLNSATMLAPAGLVVGVAGIVLRGRRR